MKKIECIIMDWAGTTVDYGCFAPVSAFIKSFGNIGIALTAQEARGPMGLNKIDHIKALFSLDRVDTAFRKLYNRPWNETDVTDRYDDFKKFLFETLADYTDPIPGVVDTVNRLRGEGLIIGSTTGYTSEMMNVVAPAAAAKGYAPDLWVTADKLPGGRPYPYMIYENMCRLAVPSHFSVLKYGDTVADVREGVNAGVWSVGVVMGSNEMGLTEAEAQSLDPTELEKKKQAVRMRLYGAGAHYVVNDMTELPALIEAINRRMQNE